MNLRVIHKFVPSGLQRVRLADLRKGDRFVMEGTDGVMVAVADPGMLNGQAAINCVQDLGQDQKIRHEIYTIPIRHAV